MNIMDLLFLFVIFWVFVLFVEATTELVCKSLIFVSFRKWVSSKSQFLKDLISCGYCTSFWMAIVPGIVLSVIASFTFSSFLYLFSLPFFVVVIHRLSNYIHNINDKFFDKYYDPRFRG